MRTLIFKAGFLFVVFVLTNNLYSQDKVKLYDTSLDGMKQIKEAATKAK